MAAKDQNKEARDFISSISGGKGNNSVASDPDEFFEQQIPNEGNDFQIYNRDRNFNSITEELCHNVNCGEAGCVVLKSRPPYRATCLCVPSLEPPDQFLKCNRTIVQAIDPTNFNDTVIRPPPPFNPQPPVDHAKGANGTSAMPLMHQDSETNAVNIVHVIVPIISAVVVIISIVAVFFLRKRREGVSRIPKSESPITWLHRQDSALLLEHMTVLSKNPNYYTPDVDGALLASIPASQIPRDRLRLLDEIGEGAFGKVYKGEILWSDDHVTKVAVKILKEDVSHESKEDFKREVEIMSSFDHENILKLIGVVPMERESPYMVFEYMEYGDLTEVLRRNDPAITSKVPIELKPTDLIDIARQVANGMKYFASRHFVHRDLATRNCLVGTGLVVKIADFGMARDIYTCDYYKIGGSRMLPVRWMAPESIKYGRYTTESDVWAYGVVLWEIFTYGKQPYYGHSNEEVIRYIEEGILLQKPPDANDHIYHVMLGCWRRDPKERFSFERVFRHLHDYDKKLLDKVLPALPTDNIIELEEV